MPSWRVPFFRQLDSVDCGPTCLRMVAAYHGRSYSLQALRQAAHIDREGVSLQGIITAAESIGFETWAGLTSLAGAEQSLQTLPLPAIVHWEGKHFVVVEKISRRHVFIADPDVGHLRLSHADFCRGWYTPKTGQGVVLLLLPEATFHTLNKEDDGSKQTSPWRRLWPMLRPFGAMLRQLLMGALGLGCIQLLFPFLTQAVVDTGIQYADLELITVLLLGMLLLFVGETSITYIQGWLLLHIGTRLNVGLVTRFLAKVMRLPIAFFDQKSTGDLLQRIDDQRRIEQFLTNSSLSAVLSVFSLLLLSVVLLVYHPGIFFLFLGASVLYVAWVMVFMSRRAKADHKRFKVMTDNHNVLLELLQGMPEIKLQQSERKRRRQWLAVQERLFETNTNFLQLTQYQDIGAQTINRVKDIFILFIAARAVINGQLTLGQMLAIQYIVGQMNAPLQRLTALARTAQDAHLSLQRLAELDDMPDEVQVPENALPLPREGALRLEEVSFAYNPLEGFVLKNLTLDIPYGKTTAIVGASGSGKTTLLKLLLGFYTPQEGKILLAGRPLQAYAPAHWRRSCGAVLQDGFLFSDSIAANIAECDERPDQERVQEAARMANLGPFLERMPQGTATKVGAQGNGLSQGQRQRLLIARAIYKDPAYLFFDEATNALDAENEQEIVRSLNQRFQGRTVVVVAHRLNTVRNAHQIIVLHNGKLVEQGTHETLVQMGGYYYNLIKNQLELGG